MMKTTNVPADAPAPQPIAIAPVLACRLTVDPALPPELPVEPKPVSTAERVTSLTTCGYPKNKDRIIFAKEPDTCNGY